MRRLVLFVSVLLLAALACVRPALAQAPLLESVRVNGLAIVGLSNRPGFSSTSGFGAGAEVQLRFDDLLFATVGFGYSKVSVHQDDPITNWVWDYWNIQYRNYIVNIWIGPDAYRDGLPVSLRGISNKDLMNRTYTSKDSTYSVRLRPVEYLNAYPLTVSFGTRYAVLDDVELSGALTGSVLFFERNLYLDESWTKRRKADAGPDSGKYTVFAYDFQNHAPSKHGQALGLGGTVTVTYLLSKSFSLSLSAAYQLYTANYRPKDNALLPNDGLLLLSAGVRVAY